MKNEKTSAELCRAIIHVGPFPPLRGPDAIYLILQQPILPNLPGDYGCTYIMFDFFFFFFFLFLSNLRFFYFIKTVVN